MNKRSVRLPNPRATPRGGGEVGGDGYSVHKGIQINVGTYGRGVPLVFLGVQVRLLQFCNVRLC